MGAKCLRVYDEEIKECKDYPNLDTKDIFTFKQVVGKGSFGRVWKVVEKRSRKVYALKAISKAKVLVKKSVHSVLKEREILGKLHHPFITNMIGAFQDR